MGALRGDLRGAVKLLSVIRPSASAAHPSLSSVFLDHSESSACLRSNSTHCVCCHLEVSVPPLPPLPPFKHANQPSFFVHLSAISLSPPFSTRACILLYIVSIFSNQLFSCIHRCHFYYLQMRKSHIKCCRKSHLLAAEDPVWSTLEPQNTV